MRVAWYFGTGLVLLLAASPLARAQGSANDAGRKQARAFRVERGAVAVDGRLDDEAWTRATPITDFVQKEPIEGATPSQAMEVRIVYDDDALYVGARMYSSDPAAIQAPMSRRDNVAQAEYLLIAIDTYLDRRTAYSFGVTASGVRLDQYHSSDDEQGADTTYDAVWAARSRIDERGWTAELWLPFSQLRFNKTEDLVFGLNIHRWIPSLQEDDYWILVGRTERGWASRFGDLRGLTGITPSRRLELLPYTALSSRIRGTRDPENPFDADFSATGHAGLDVKLGIGPNLTVDATVNPDFRQVDADPAEVNLSTTETQFAERRPFFLEGSRLITGGTGTTYLYSRRIGRRPTAPVTGDYVDRPDATTILGAAKLTGRLASGTSIAALGGVTGEEFARTFTRDESRISKTRIAPRTTYAAGRIQQEFGPEGSAAGLLLTHLHRDLDAGDPLAALFVRNAFTATADSTVRFANRTYQASGFYGVSVIQGEPAAMERVQRSTVHYFQRTDRPAGVRLDPTRRSMSGGVLQSRLEKIGGTHWLWLTNYRTDSPESESNDLGRMSDAGDDTWTNAITYRETQPGPVFRAYSSELAWLREGWWDAEVDPKHILRSTNNVTWHNFWTTTLSVARGSRSMSPFLTRGGPRMGMPSDWTLEASLANSTAAETHWAVDTTFSWSEAGDRVRAVTGNLSLRPRPAWQLQLDPVFRREIFSQQYVARLDGGRADTFGSRYVFGVIDRSTISLQTRVSYTFKPDVNVDFYAEPFAASGRYDRLGELSAAGSRVLRVYGEETGTTLARQPDGGYEVTDGDAVFTLDNQDFSTLSFRSNLVFRWEWRPGSTLYLVWQQDRASTRAVGDHPGFGDLFDSLSAPGDNSLAVKASFWISP